VNISEKMLATTFQNLKRFLVRFVPPCNPNGKIAKCRYVSSVRNACAERVSQQIYQSHAGPRLRLHLMLKNSLVKFSNPNEKLVELYEPRDRESFQSPTQYEFAEGI